MKRKTIIGTISVILSTALFREIAGYFLQDHIYHWNGWIHLLCFAVAVCATFPFVSWIDKKMFSSTIQASRMMKTFLYYSIGLFLVSLLMLTHCADLEGDVKCYGPLGILDLLFGGLAVLAVGIGVNMPLAGGMTLTLLTWYANPMLAMAWITFKHPKVSFLFSLLAVLISASFLLCTLTLGGEVGHVALIQHRHLGYWLWLSSTGVMLMGNCILMIILCYKPQTSSTME
jgi:hypothetical protein